MKYLILFLLISCAHQVERKDTKFVGYHRLEDSGMIVEILKKSCGGNVEIVDRRGLQGFDNYETVEYRCKNEKEKNR